MKIKIDKIIKIFWNKIKVIKKLSPMTIIINNLIVK